MSFKDIKKGNAPASGKEDSPKAGKGGGFRAAAKNAKNKKGGCKKC